jgi:hypothetical protein
MDKYSDTMVTPCSDMKEMKILIDKRGVSVKNYLSWVYLRARAIIA